MTPIEELQKALREAFLRQKQLMAWIDDNHDKITSLELRIMEAKKKKRDLEEAIKRKYAVIQ